jgi:hypothetical protein
MRWILLLVFCLSANAQLWSRAQIYRALVEAQVLDPDRRLVHFSHTCSLRIEGAEFPVVDVQEIVKGAVTPRGVNRIVVFAPGGKAVQLIGYTTERPLFCDGNRLYVFGDLEVDGVGPEGNVLTFSARGKQVKLSHIEANDYPVPATRARRRVPQ